MNVFVLEGWISFAAMIALVAVKAYALISALTFPDEAYKAGDKLTKVGWCAILGIGLVAQIFIQQPINLINIAFTIAAFVYLVDVKPTLSELVRR